jgi:electron-transferring-flavoprotein dehydrogenase
MVVSLDSPDPLLNPHEALQRLKTHPLIRNILRDGKPKYYGAKAISAGGYYTVPALYTSGALIVGESASLVNMARLKGIHAAIQSGMMAAETVFEAMKREDYTERTLSGYRHRMENSALWKELYGVRNVHQALGSGSWKKFVHLGLQFLTGGRGIRDPLPIRPDPARTEPMIRYYPEGVEAQDRVIQKDGVYLLDKLTDVFNAGVLHEENQPSHLKIVKPEICVSCWNEYRSPCTHFCPAQVYEMPTPEETPENTQARLLRVNFINCVHCKCCDIKCPHLNIRWMPPEGGGGPRYTLL